MSNEPPVADATAALTTDGANGECATYAILMTQYAAAEGVEFCRV